jgi:hypothetical protein
LPTLSAVGDGNCAAAVLINRKHECLYSWVNKPLFARGVRAPTTKYSPAHFRACAPSSDRRSAGQPKNARVVVAGGLTKHNGAEVSFRVTYNQF